MFLSVAGFELRYQLRQPVFWVSVVIFFLMTFLSIVSDNVSIGGAGGGTHKNAAFAIANTTMTLSIFYMFVSTAFIANIVVRDDETGFGPLIRATRLSRFDYLYGRFAGAFAAAAIGFLSVPLAIIVGAMMPWMDPETVGPFAISHYAFAVGALALPTLFLTAALFFALTTLTRSMMFTYVGAVTLTVATLVAGIVLDKPQFEQAAALWEPFGSAAYGLATKYWTASERNVLVPAFSGFLLYNRLIMTGIGVALLAAAYVLYGLRDRPAEPAKARAAITQETPPALTLPTVTRFGRGAAFAQLAARTRLDMAQVFKSPAYAVLLAIGLLNSIAGLWFTTDVDAYGGSVHPVTRLMIFTLYGAFTIIPVVIAVYYAGELVWRERERRTHEIIDASPLPDWAYVIPKTLAITLVLVSTVAVSIVASLLVQALKGWFDFEFGKYLVWYLLPGAVDMAFLAALAVFCQVLSPHKFIGWGLMILYVVGTMTLGNLGFDHMLYLHSPFSAIPLSDMNGQGKFWIGAWWGRLYWSAIGLVLLVVAYATWRRGTETRLLPRLARLPRRMKGPAGLLAVLGLGAILGAGIHIFINTAVLNEYRTQPGDERYTADLEKALLRYENTPQPTPVDVKLTVDLYPHQTRAQIKGVVVLQNDTGAPLREAHLRFDRDLQVDGLSLQGARPLRTYDRFNYRIFAFDAPMAPGEQRTLAFAATRQQRGFKNSGDTTRLVDNGTFLDSTEIGPQIGITRSGLLEDRAKRRKYGLAPELRPAPLGDQPSRRRNYLGGTGWATSDITVSTVADQTPMAPGYKVSDETRGGRRTARFVSEAPILTFYSMQSARYAVKTQDHKGIALSVYYDAQHPYNVDRMLAASRASLDYFQANFSPYQFRQLRILEFPDYARFAQSFANTVPWSEGMGFIADYSDPEKIDLVTYITAHEIGHQWWAHQVVGADQQGASMLSETLAQYSALMVMKHMYGPDMVRKFLKFELDRYLRARGGAVVDEQPLAKVEIQDYIYYRKGSVAMYRLADEVGEAAVNRALRRLLKQYAFKAAPYSTTLDFLAALRAEAPADKQALITDLFEKITLYDVKTKAMTVRPRADGRFDVTLTVEARKLYAEGRGRETEAPMDETVEMGLFGVSPADAKFRPADVIAVETRRLRTGTQTLSFTVDRRPAFGGADPYNKLIDRNSDDNIAEPG